MLFRSSFTLSLSEQDSLWTCVSQHPLKFQKSGTGDESNGLGVKCVNGTVSLWSHRVEGQSKSATYSQDSARASLGTARQEETEMQLVELLGRWFS